MVSTVGNKFVENLLKRYSTDSIITVERSSDVYFSILEKRFPLYGSKIDWDSVPGALQKESNVQDSDNFFKDAFSFLNELESHGKMSDSDEVIIVSDSAIEEAIRMPLKILKEILRDLLELPHHLYILQENGDWCLAITMEGSLCFAHSSVAGR
ncbi:hypothetical protein MHK_008630 [Candidatus Magnetomorum sp. HK-1]|nr:hypothetical protein MHK_008630 [Candidatus Magnetomorum sp. HK-1]